MSGQIFISYRRDDASFPAGRLYDHLSRHFLKNQIFMDVDNLEPGADFLEAIKASVDSCEVLIAVIGKDWLSSTDKDGKRRLDKPDDFVRIEIATALKRGIGVIPVSVERTPIPDFGELPDDLKPLVRHNALEISHKRFDGDLRRLIDAIERIFQEADAKRKQLEKQRLERDAEAATAQDNFSPIAEAQRLFDAQDYTKARTLFEKAAENDDALAMLRLGDMCFKGFGIARNSDQALSWYRKAAVLGNIEAAKALGKLCMMGHGGKEDFRRAVACYEKAAEAGNRGAMRELGLLYSEGPIGTRNFRTAAEWYEKAALKGSTRAMFALAQLHENNGDHERAIDWYERGAAAGDDSAKRRLAGLSRFSIQRWFKGLFNRSRSSSFIAQKQKL
jgi:TPR repeat protein